jgi:hypothetical protein
MKIQCDINIPADVSNVGSYKILVTTTVTLAVTTFPVPVGAKSVFWNSAIGTICSITQVETDPLGTDSVPSDPFSLTVTADIGPSKPGTPTAKIVSITDDPTLLTI